MEKEHKDVFSTIRSKLGSKERRKPSAELSEYLAAMADGSVFNYREDSTKVLSGLKTVRDILRTAIGMEKDSIIFYTGLKDLVPGRLGRDKVEEIIRQEMWHVSVLARELKKGQSVGKQGG